MLTLNQAEAQAKDYRAIFAERDDRELAAEVDGCTTELRSEPVRAVETATDYYRVRAFAALGEQARRLQERMSANSDRRDELIVEILTDERNQDSA